VYLVCLVYLVDLVCFVYLVDLVHLVSFIQPKYQTNQRNQIDQTNEILAAKGDWQDLTLNLLMSYDLAVPPGALAYVNAVVWRSLF
jgi:hypothetical protein